MSLGDRLGDLRRESGFLFSRSPCSSGLIESTRIDAVPGLQCIDGSRLRNRRLERNFGEEER